MNYRQLQKILKRYKQEGLTDIALNSKKAVLQAELDRLRRSEGDRDETSDDLDWYPDPMRLATLETETYQPKYNGLLTSLILLLLATIKILIVTVLEPLVILIEGLKQLQLIPPTIPKLLPQRWYRIKSAIV